MTTLREAKIDFPILDSFYLGKTHILKLNRSVVLKAFYNHAVKSIIILLTVSIISLIGSFILGKKLVYPLLILKEKANQLKNGDYSVRTHVVGNDEIASTAEAFDLMADSIQEYDKLKSQLFS